MGQRIFVLIVTAKLPRKSCKPSLESTLLVCNPCPGFNKGRKALGKDLALAVSIAAKEFAHSESKPYALATTWHVSYTAVVIAMNRGRGPRTQRTTRRRRG